MVHTGFPSSGLCSGGSSDPFSLLCVRRLPRSGRSSSALSYPPPRFHFPHSEVCHPKRSDRSFRPYRKESIFPPLLSQRAHASKTRANNHFIFSSIQAHIFTTLVESHTYKSGGVFFMRSLRPANSKVGQPILAVLSQLAKARKGIEV